MTTNTSADQGEVLNRPAPWIYSQLQVQFRPLEIAEFDKHNLNLQGTSVFAAIGTEGTDHNPITGVTNFHAYR